MTDRMRAAEFRAIRQEPKPSKYRNRKVVVAGHRFDSKKEAQRYLLLKARQDAGEIANLELQPVFRLKVGDRPLLLRSKGYPNGRQAKFTADFAYWDCAEEKRIVEDVKSPVTRTEAYVLRKAIVEAMFPAVKIVEV